MDEANNRKPTGRRKQTQVKPEASAYDIQSIGKIPPQAVDLEEAVLGAMMLEKDALTTAIDMLKPEVFYKETHQRIYAAMRRLFENTKPVDLLTVVNELRNTGEIDLIGGPSAITQLTNQVASGANIDFHGRVLLEKYIQREIISISSNSISNAYDDGTDAFDLLDGMERELFTLSDVSSRRNFIEVSELVKDAMEEINKAAQHKDQLTGVPSGFSELDRITNGWQKSDLIILAARPGMGKTALALSMARNAAVEKNRPIAIFSLEMSAVQLVTRLISAESEIPMESIRRGHLSEAQWSQLHERVSLLSASKMYIDDTPALSILELRAKCRRLRSQYGIEAVVVDYMQLMTGSKDNKANRQEEISVISRSLKSLAKELNIPFIVLSQLSRKVEERGKDKRPQLSDLRESGAIEQDADIVLFIYRPEYYPNAEDEPSSDGTSELLIAKHRNGRTGKVELRFVKEFVKFDNVLGSQQDLGRGFIDDRYNKEDPKTVTRPSKMNSDDDGF